MRAKRVMPWMGRAALWAVLWGLMPAGEALASCQLLAERAPRVMPASLRVAAAGQVNITFLGHSSFLIQTPGGASAVTDFNGHNRPTFVPDIVTMNNAHSTHFTEILDPAIKHVLRGWVSQTGDARHDVRHIDLRVRNVPTDVRGWGDLRPNGNSIFVFEVADLCIAHVGHLHHPLLPVHLSELGQIDVLMVPVDGAFTMGQVDMLDVMQQLKSPVVLPMHFFSEHTLAAFLDRARGAGYAIRVGDVPRTTVSRADLPRQREVRALPGR